MAMRFGDAILNRVLSECFKPAAQRAGFILRPLNEAPSAGLIDNQIRAAIRTARFVVADLTHDNNSAYFEAGFAEGLGVPVIYTCEAQKFNERKTHFDTNHMLTVP
jgi:nucleoside 2-deoxyribosyltransferase